MKYPKIAAALAFLLAPFFISAQSLGNVWKGQPPPLAIDYDVDSTSYFYPTFCSPLSASTTDNCGPGSIPREERRLITTSGSASATITTVASSAAFSQVSVGDLLLIKVPATTLSTSPTSYMVKVLTKASSDSITVSSALVNIPTAGVGFVWWKASNGSAADSGWMDCSGLISFNALIDIDQISVTGGIDYTLEGRHYLGGTSYSSPFAIVATTNKTAVSVSQAAWSLSGTGQGPWSQCRVGLKVGTADDDGITITATTDNIDFKEYVNSYTVAGSNDLDFVEDAGGTPITCNADVAAGTYTGAALAALITTEMNDDVANCSDVLANTYTVTYSTSTHKFTVARTTGAATLDLLWATGTNTATSMKTLLGYADPDDNGGTSYASDSATGESIELVGVVASALYTSGTTACTAVAAAMNAEAVAGTYACSYSAADKITISATGITQLMLFWNSGTNNATAADTALGFAADLAGALTYEGAALGSDDAAEIEKVTITVAGYK